LHKRLLNLNGRKKMEMFVHEQMSRGGELLLPGRKRDKTVRQPRQQA